MPAITIVEDSDNVLYETDLHVVITGSVDSGPKCYLVKNKQTGVIENQQQVQLSAMSWADDVSEANGKWLRTKQPTKKKESLARVN